MSTNMSATIFAIGNPLLDIELVAADELLQRYNLQPDNAILAAPEHDALYNELAANPEVKYIAGGAAQNAVRGAQWLLPPGSTFYTGCVGADENAGILRSAAQRDGVTVLYQTDCTAATGTCAVLVTNNGASRSLVARLAAAERFTVLSAEAEAFAAAARIVYIGGFFLTVAGKVAADLARTSLMRGAIVALNLSAPFICGPFVCKDALDFVLDAVSLVFGNDSELAEFAKTRGGPHSPTTDAALWLADYGAAKQKTVVITQGPKDVVVVHDGRVATFAVPALHTSHIVDTNGAGDGFVGGYLARLLENSELRECVYAGIWTAQNVIAQSGVVYPQSASLAERISMLTAFTQQ